MAKRTPNRSTAEDSGAASSPQPKPRRPRTVAPTSTESAAPQAREQELAPAPSHEQAQQQHNGADIPSEAGDDAPLESMASRSMGSEPSEEDIRLRAYHRYLERGGGHGMDFEDWLEAERELRIR